MWRALGIVAALSARALAEPQTAADVADAPLPGDESGRTDAPPRDSLLRRAGRAALLPPKLVVEASLLPVRSLVWAQDTYHLDTLYYRAFYNADRTIGLYPTASYASGYGFDAGARFDALDAFGGHERISAEAMTGALVGDDYHETVAVSAGTGEWLGRMQLAAAASFERRPGDPFYGVGNDDMAIATHYRYQELRTALEADLRVAGTFHVRATGAIANHRYGVSTSGPPLDMVYDTADLAGWTGFSNAYGELELRIDERKRATLWEPRDLHAEGWLAAAALGRAHDLGGGGDFWRGTAELQQFIRLAKGPRVLALRVRGEAVSGSTSEVPFSELPALGGTDFLRGYDFQRFRDRVAMLGSAEYIWDLGYWCDAAIFVDAGRVYSSLSAVELSHMRVGFGAALEIYNQSRFLFELGLASSIEGGAFLQLSFNRIFDARPKWR